MVQGYYSLEDAARILGMPAEDLSQMAQRREVRAFADRGTWRFRTQDIEELARRRGLGSNPDLQLGDAPAIKPHDSPAPPPTPDSDEDVLNFPLGSDSDQVEIGQEIVSGSSSKVVKTGSKATKNPGPKSPPPKPGSDSDVRLVSDGSDIGLSVASDSDVKIADSGPRSKPGQKKKSGPKQDSGAKLVMDSGESDSDVKIIADSSGDSDVLGRQPMKTGSDSDVRLELGDSSSRNLKPEDSFLTEEIDLDAELQKAEEEARPKKAPPTPKSKARPRPPEPPPTSPFELSDADLPTPKAPEPPATESDSSDFDLSLDVKEDLSPLELSSGEIVVDSAKDEEVSLGDMPSKGGGAAHDSGINLQSPADSGISLEQGGESSDEIEFEISLDAEASPKPASKPSKPASKPSKPSKAAKPAKQEAAPSNVDSSSEFELTLEDSAGLLPLEEEAVTEEAAEDEKDIFETDFDVPALEDESGSQVAAVEESDTDLESSDFDLALSDEDMAAEDESGSQVVALEDEEAVDEGAETVARPRKAKAAAAVDQEADELLADEEPLEEAEAGVGRRTVMVAAPPANWGTVTPIVLMFSVLVMFFVGLMSFELVRSMWGYHQPTKVTSGVIRTLAGMFYDQKDLPPE